MKMLSNERAFTLVEMLIVLLIISLLILLIVPNLTDKSKNINNKSCDALKELVQSQVIAYEIDRGKLPNNLNALVEAKYIKSEQLTCGNDKTIKMDSNGDVYTE